VLVHHFGRVAVEPSFLPPVADAFETVAAGEAPSAAAQDCLGRDVREVRFGGFSILLAP
jgi:hypothetical protein